MDWTLGNTKPNEPFYWYLWCSGYDFTGVLNIPLSRVCGHTLKQGIPLNIRLWDKNAIPD